MNCCSNHHNHNHQDDEQYYHHYSILLSQVVPLTRCLLVFIIVVLLVRLWLQTFSKLPRPPGPHGLPFLGFLPFLGKDFHLTLTNLSRKYGPVYQIFLGRNRIIVVSDASIVRKAFRKLVFSGRPESQLTRLLQGYGIVNSEGELWREQRAFLHRVLRQFSARKTVEDENGLEAKLRTQVNQFLKVLKELERKPLRIRPLLACAVSNVVGSLLVSLTFHGEDKTFRRLLSLMEEGFRLVTVAMPVNVIPFLRFIPFINSAYQKIKQNKTETGLYFKKIVDEHRRTLNPNKIRDICDAYIMEQEKVKLEGKKSYFSEEQLIQIMNDMFSAGLETVTSTLEWAILFLMLNPSVQREVQKEIDSVTKGKREPVLEDMQLMPYTEATIYEVLRRSNVIALGNAHSSLIDAELCGFHIPKNSQILPNLYAINMDPELWEDPEKFEPLRFLKDGKVFKPQYFIPFSVGRRMCLGDSLTKMEVFLFLTNLLNLYNLDLPSNGKIPSTQGIIATSNVPKPYEVCVVPRVKW